MYCYTCKKNVPDGRFCTFCGKEVIKNAKKEISLYSKLLIILTCICVLFSIILPGIVANKVSETDITGAVSGLPVLFGSFVDIVYFPLIIGLNITFIKIIEKLKSNSKKIVIFLISILLNIILFFLFEWIFISSLIIE